MSATDTFAKLKVQAEEADRIVRAAADQNRAEVEQKLNEARRDADERAAELRAKGQDDGACRVPGNPVCGGPAAAGPSPRRIGRCPST